MSDLSRAVFLSYASQDRDAAQRITAALRAAGIEVWFDQAELRGGDAWDQKIRRQIRDCTLFIPLISSSTASRHEGYFRLEWDLADQRSHMMARNHVFIVPVCLDESADHGADAPESFQRVQWTRLLLRGDRGHESFWFLEPAHGSERQLAELPADFVIRDFDVSPDGSELVFDRVEEDSRIALIERPTEG